MRAILSVLAVTAMLSVTTVAPAIGQTTGEGAPQVTGPIDSLVKDYIAKHNLPGATVAVTRGGRLVLSRGYGHANPANNTPMEPWHRSYIGSVSKVITAIGALKLTESGELSLDNLVYGIPGPFNNPEWPGPVPWPGVLWDSGDYYNAILEGVKNMHPPNFVHTEMNKTIGWTSKILIRHLLSHTSGLIGSGDRDAASKFYKKPADDLTYKQLHMAVLMALRKVREDHPDLKNVGDGSQFVDEDDDDFEGKMLTLPPFGFAPGEKWSYSNHGFGLMGHIIGRALGASNENVIPAYVQHIKQNVLHPLGLADVVPNNTALGPLDAVPHIRNKDTGVITAEQPEPRDAPDVAVSTGGWSASARDLVRVMCALDRKSNNLRILNSKTVTEMESDAVETVSGRPIGWDIRTDSQLRKGGLIHSGGRAYITKFLPGKFGTDDEINVAIAINLNYGPQPETLLQNIAKVVAEAYVAEDYDLFDKKYACYNPPPRRFQVLNVTLAGFYPSKTPNLLPPKIEAECPIDIDFLGTFAHQQTGKATYRFRFSEGNRVSGIYSKTLDGDPKNPVYQTPTVMHTFPFPLPPLPQGADPKPGGIQDLKGQQAKPKGPEEIVDIGKLAGNQYKGSVRIEIVSPPGGTVSNWVPYHIACIKRAIDLPGQIVTPGKQEPPEKPKIIVKDPEPPSPRLVCVGGRVTGTGARAVCDCPRGLEAKLTGVNRFQCEPTVVQIACAGGTVRGADCVCPRGHEATQVGPNRFRCEPTVVPITCAGGAVRGEECVCARTLQKVQTGPAAWRCVRVPTKTIQPATKAPTVLPARITCDGGEVKDGECECPRGTQRFLADTANAWRCVGAPPPAGVRIPRQQKQR